MQHKMAYIWGLAGKFVPSFIHLAANIVLARFLTPDDFGTIGVVTIIFTVANVLIDSGLGGSLVKEREISKLDCSTIAAFNSVVGLIFFLGVFFTAGFWEDYFEIKNLTGIIQVLSLTFLIGPLGLVPKALMNRDLKFGAISVIAISGVLVASVVAIVMAALGAGVWSLVVFQLVNTSVMVLASCLYCKYVVSFRFSMKSLKRLFSFGFFTTVTSVIDTIYENLITTLTGKYLNVSHAGYLSQGKKLEEALTSSMASAIGNVSFPIITKLKDDMPAFKKECFSVYKIIPVLSFPLLLMISAYSTEIVVLLFGNQWSPAGPYLSALIFAGLLIILETLIRSFIKSFCEVKKLAVATLVKRVIGILILVVAIIIKPGAIVYAYIISSLVGLIVNGILFHRILSVSIWELTWRTLVVLIPAIIAYLVVLLIIKNITASFFLQMGLSVLVLSLYYVICLPLFKVSLIRK